ncbi:UNVERIFIED_CONTAM: hypothetical protein RKD43_006924 [Streptomyces graminofaciens]
MCGFDGKQQVPTTDPGFDRDGILHLLQWLAEQSVVASISAVGKSSLTDEPKWVFRAASGPSVPSDLRQNVETEESTAGQCVCMALPLLKEAGLSMSGGSWISGLEELDCTEGTGVLVLDWLVEQGVSVFLKADGERATPGWTLIVHGGALPDILRFDGRQADGCFRRMLLDLRGQGLAVPL